MSGAARRATILVAAMGAMVSGTVATYFVLPSRSQELIQRAAVRSAGEVIELALRVYDPYASQQGAEVGGMPDASFTTAVSGDTVWRRLGDGRSRIRVAAFSIAPIPTRPPFMFESWDDPGLAELRERYPIGHLVRNPEPDFSSLVELSSWVAHRWSPGGSAPPLATHFDARQVLRRAERGESFDCGTFAWTLIQVLAAVGINARLVELEDARGNGHSVVEAWCDDAGKWVLLDPYSSVTFTWHGVPLNALDLHRLWRSGRWSEIHIVTPPDIPNPVERDGLIPRDRFALYEHFNVRMRNNLRSSSYPRWHPLTSRVMSAWEWAGDEPGRAFYRLAVHDSAALYFSLKTTAVRWQWLEPDSSREPQLEVHLASCVPNFESFVYSSDGHHWIPLAASARIRIPPGTDSLRFAVVNRAGRVGRVSWLALETAAGDDSHTRDQRSDQGSTLEGPLRLFSHCTRTMDCRRSSPGPRARTKNTPAPTDRPS